MMTDGQTDGRTDKYGENNMFPPDGERHNHNRSKETKVSTRSIDLAIPVIAFRAIQNNVRSNIRHEEIPNNHVSVYRNIS